MLLEAPGDLAQLGGALGLDQVVARLDKMPAQLAGIFDLLGLKWRV